MTATKTCPRCGTALKASGDKFVCPSCRASIVRKPRSAAAADGQKAAPVPAPAVPTLELARTPARGLVLGSTVLFLLLGTVLTGYAFTLTFSPQSEPPPAAEQAKEKPSLPEPPAEDWRITLRDLRELVTTPPSTLTGPAENPSRPPRESAKVNQVIDKGVAYLKEAVAGRGGTGRNAPNTWSLAGLTLLECGVPKDDPAVTKVTEYIRNRAPTASATYELATQIWFLDRLADPGDRELIRSLALRLIANQGPMGGWGYSSGAITASDEKRLLQLLAEKPLHANWRQEMNAALVPDGGGKPSSGGGRSPARVSRMDSLPLFRWEPGKKYDWRSAGHEDNSLTQFAVLALWSARKHGVPVERCLAFVEARFRTHQNADGSWGYKLGTTARRDSMTCAGLLGLAVGRGLDKQSAAHRTDVTDKAIEKGLVYLGQVVGKPALNRGTGGRGKVIGAQGWGDLYFLWSLERMCVVYDLKTVAGKNWYAWGAKLLTDSQASNGMWSEAFAGIPDTCFALLFLKRVNIVQDLTAQLRLLGKVKDPGHARQSVVLPSETAKPDEP